MSELVTALVFAFGWSPRDVWEMPLWELWHWTSEAMRRAKQHGK